MTESGFVFLIGISFKGTNNFVNTFCDQKTFIEMGNILNGKDGFCDAGGKIFTNM